MNDERWIQALRDDQTWVDPSPAFAQELYRSLRTQIDGGRSATSVALLAAIVVVAVTLLVGGVAVGSGIVRLPNVEAPVPPAPVRECELVVTQMHDDHGVQEYTRLVEPYQAERSSRTNDVTQAIVLIHGEGWGLGRLEVDYRYPGERQYTVSADALTLVSDGMGFHMPKLGRYEVSFRAEAGCRASVSIEVVRDGERWEPGDGVIWKEYPWPTNPAPSR